MEIEGVKILNKRPIAPKYPIQCPWCSEQPPMPPGRLAQHVRNEHPLHWKGSIYDSLPPNFDYGNGPLSEEVRTTLVRYAQYAKDNYRRIKQERQQRGKPRGPYGPRKKSMSAVRRGQLGGLARAAKARAAEPQEANGLLPRFDRSVKFCPHCGWNIDAMQKAQAFVDGRAE